MTQAETHLLECAVHIPDDRYRDALAPLVTFCAAHGYCWRWKIEHREQWHAKVQIIDPTQSDRLERVRSWTGSSGHDEVPALERAARYAVEFAQAKLDGTAITASGRL